VETKRAKYFKSSSDNPGRTCCHLLPSKFSFI